VGNQSEEIESSIVAVVVIVVAVVEPCQMHCACVYVCCMFFLQESTVAAWYEQVMLVVL